MRVKLELVICHEDGQEETVTDVITLNKNNQRIEHLGLSLAESKHLLGTLQRHLLQQQISSFLDTHSTCPDCGTPLKLKAHGGRSFRTLFGTFTFHSPRFEHYDCKQCETASFRPLSALLTEPVAPELLYMEAKWSSLVSYGLSLDTLKDFLPIDLSLDVKTVRSDTLTVAKRLEAELGEDQASFIEGEPSDWELLPPPEGSFTVGIDGGYVRNWVDKKHKFEVIVGKSIRRFDEREEEDKTPSLKRFGFVQTLDTKSQRRLYEVLQSQDLQMNQAITFLSDGNDSLRQLQLEMSPKATHILDWYHLSMKLTVLGQYGKGLVQPTFKGSECPCRFFALRALHTTRSRGPVHHRPAGDRVGHQRTVRPLDHLSIIAPVRLVQTRPTRLQPLGWRSGLCCRGAAGHACVGTDGPVAGSRCRGANQAPSASLRPRSVRASPATRGRSPRDS